MNKLNPERLKSARILKGLSLQELADELEQQGQSITRQSLFKYEKGDVTPNEDMIHKLSHVLGVDTSYFYKRLSVTIEKVDFRKFSHLVPKEEDRIIELTKEKLSNYIEIEEILLLQNEFKSPFKERPVIINQNDIELAAEKLRIDWELGKSPINNVVELLEDNNIKVIPINADDSFDGLSTMVKEKYAVIVYNERNINKSDRIRFTLLHELAHLLLDFDPSLVQNQIEILCHQFAGAMLMPEKTLKTEIGDRRSKLSIQELGNIKKQYGISMQAIVMRAQDLQIITSTTAKQFFYFIRQVGWKIDEPIQYDYIGSEQSNRFEQLTFRAVAEDMISKDHAAQLFSLSVNDFNNKYALL